MRQTSRTIFIAILSAIFVIGYDAAIEKWAAAAQPQVFLVFFNFNSDELEASGETVIKHAVDAWGKKTGYRGGIYVTGYTDRSLSPEESQQLAERRAKNVASALNSLLMPVSRIFVDARGENDNRVPTGPGVREQQNERVELIILSEQEVRQAQQERDHRAVSNRVAAPLPPSPKQPTQVQAPAPPSTSTIEVIRSNPTPTVPLGGSETAQNFETKVKRLQQNAPNQYIPVTIPDWGDNQNLFKNLFTESRLYHDRLEMAANLNDPRMRKDSKYYNELRGMNIVEKDGRGETYYFGNLTPCAELRPDIREASHSYTKTTGQACLQQNSINFQLNLILETRGPSTEQFKRSGQCQILPSGHCDMLKSHSTTFVVLPK